MTKLLGAVLAAVLATAAPSTAIAEPSPAKAPVARKLTFNAQRLDAKGVAIIEKLEAFVGVRLPDGEYWYDPTSGASGVVGGPMGALLPTGMPLGGALRADASGGGKGNVTGTFVNGRELHPTDVASLKTFLPRVDKGRFWVDGQGNVGLEGGPMVFNLYAAWEAAQPPRSTRSKDGRTWVGKNHATTTWGSDGGRIKNHCSWSPDGGTLCSKTANW